MAKSVYIHIPFCKSKCKYCSFISYANLEKIKEYLSALIFEIDTDYKGEDIKTLYFGGGTPSLLPIEFVKNILDKFNLTHDCEITFEFNPDDCDLEYLQNLKSIGINRLSIGSQSFNDNILKVLGRRHNSNDIINMVKTAKIAGFNNISLDLIYGLPFQTIDLLKKDLEKIISLDIQHISTYGLKIEESSFWGKNSPKNLPDEDIQADMYILINEILEKNGYNRYEISNFSSKGFESKHNLNYWNNKEYYGFGVSAHGYLNGIRYSNELLLDKYIETPIKRISKHIVTNKEMLEETIFLGFRKTEGINVSQINQKFSIDFENKFKSAINKFTPEYMIKTKQGYSLTIEGVLLSNLILSEFIE